MRRFDVRKEFLEGASQELDAREFLALRLAMMRRPFKAMAFFSDVEEQLQEMNAITSDGEIAAAFDWKSLLKELLPIFLRLFGL